MENRLYEMMEDMGGMSIPLNQPRGSSQNKRLGTRGGRQAADFPEALVVEQPVNRNAQ
jgi:N-acetylglucosamine-6-sulfatase